MYKRSVIVCDSELGSPPVHITALEVINSAKDVVQVMCGACHVLGLHGAPGLVHCLFQLHARFVTVCMTPWALLIHSHLQEVEQAILIKLNAHA